MKKYFVIILVSLGIGFLLSYYTLKEYEDITLPTISNGETVYLVQQGVYSSMESMNEHTKDLTDYIYTQIDGMYYVYIGVSLTKDNALKIQEYYDIETIIKTVTMTNKDYIDTLRQLDSVLSELEDKEAIKEIIKEGLKKYQGG